MASIIFISALCAVVYVFLFFAIRACIRDWRNQESHVKRYGRE